ncbi:MAG TPA: VWA domain-containing protein [Egibacteraceae bacterium]|nr:VWA domain-containing protein [Egibacteraceae bacterium]
MTAAVRIALITALLTAVIAAPAAAAEEAADLRILDSDVAQYPQIDVTLALPAGTGAEVPADAIVVREAGALRPATLRHVSTDSLEVVLLIDTSGSMGASPMAAAKAAAIQFVGQMPPSAQVGVIAFSTQPALVTGLTDDREATTAAIDGLQSGGRTALYDAISLGRQQFSDSPGVQRSLIVLSDGGDNASAAALEEMISQLSSGGIHFHGIELQTAESDPVALGRLAEAATGSLVSAEDPAALSRLYDQIASELINQYTVRYTSESHGRTEVTIDLDHEGVVAQARATLDLPAAPLPRATTPPAPLVLDPTLKIVAVDESSYPEVEVRIVAPRGLEAVDLEAAAFELVESGRGVDVEVSRVPADHADVVLLVDTSGSMAGASLSAAKDAATTFVSALPAAAEVALVSFAEEPVVVTDFTADAQALRAAIDGLEASGETALYDAVLAAARMLEGRGEAPRTVLLLSDGGDTVSSTTQDRAARALAATSAAVFPVLFQTEETDVEALRELAGPQSNPVVQVDDAASVTTALEELSTDLENQYVLRYRSLAHGSTDVGVTLAIEGAEAKGRTTVVLPPAPWLLAFFQSPWAMATGAALFYIALTLIVLVILSPGPVRVRMAGTVWDPAPRGPGPQRLSTLGDWAKARVDQGLQRSGLGASLNSALERAGIILRPSEFVLLVMAGVVVIVAVVAMSVGPLFGLGAGGLALLACRSAVKLLGERRRSAFNDQLSDTLQLLAGSIRTGYGLLQAVQSVANEADSPTSDEFRRIMIETRLGRDLGETLDAMVRRVGSQDFEWVVQAIEINREVGGDLAEVLESVSKTVRAREEMRRQIKTLSADGRLSAAILLALPFIVVGAISLINPGYMNELFTTSVGRFMLGACLLLMTVGGLWVRRLVRVVY